MDDINLMSSSVHGAQTLLECCATALHWAGMDFRAEKSRSFVIVKGKSLNCTPFSVSIAAYPTDFSSCIPSIHSMPVKFLGRIIDGSISDRKSVDELEKKLSDGLKLIDKPLKPSKIVDFATPFNPKNSVASSYLRSVYIHSNLFGTESVLFYKKMASFAPIDNQHLFLCLFFTMSFTSEKSHYYPKIF